MKKILLLATTLLAFALPISAETISGVEVPASITTNQQELVFNGAGIRSKFFMDLYVGSLFTKRKTQNATDVVEGRQPAAIRLNITSGMITAEKLTDALNEGFDLATGGDTSAIDSSIQAFVEAAFVDAVSDGDQFTFVSVPGEGLYSYKNGKALSVNRDEAFRKALMAIWLGDKPADKKLKKRMLKG